MRTVEFIELTTNLLPPAWHRFSVLSIFRVVSARHTSGAVDLCDILKECAAILRIAF